MSPLWLLGQLTVTAALTGLCLTVDVAIYAHFSQLLTDTDVERFKSYHAAYVQSMGRVAGPLMVAEMGLVAWGCWADPFSSGAWLGAGAVVLIWSLTFGLIVPVHNRLQSAPDHTTIARLNRLNWVRTALWATRVILVLGMYLADQPHQAAILYSFIR